MNKRKLLTFALGPVGSGVLAIVTIPLVAWFFSPVDVGRYYVLQTVISFALIVLFLGLDQAYVREFHEAEDTSALLRGTFVPGFALLALLVAIAIPFSRTLSEWLFDSQTSFFIWIALGCIFCAFVSRQLSLILRMRERALAFSISQLLPKTFFILFLAGTAALSSQRNFGQLALALLVSSAAIMIAYLWITRPEWTPAFRSRKRKVALDRLLRFGFPLMLASLGYWGLTATSIFVLRGTSDLEQIGIYSVAMSVAGVAAVFQAVFSVVWAPVVYRWVAIGADLAHVDQIARQALVLVVAILSGCGAMFWVLGFVLPPEYAIVKYLFLCTVVQPLLYTLSEVTGIGIAITRRTAFSLWTILVALATNIVLNLLWTPALGAAGAVMANALSFVVFFVGRTEASARLWRGFARARMYSIVLAGVGLSLITVLLGPQIGYLLVALWVAYGAVCLWALRDDVRPLLVRFGRQP